MKKIFALILALAMVLSMVACGAKEEAAPVETKAPDAATEAVVEEEGYVDPFAEYADDYDALSQAVYDEVLGEFYTYYEAAQAATDTAERYALMAIAEAKMLSAGIFLPTTSQGGNYAMTKVAPYTNTPVLFGNDTYRLHDRIVTTEPITAAHIAEMKAEWVKLMGTGTYEQYVKDFLAANGYTTVDVHNYYYDADPEMWDVLATSMAADSEILVNTYDGLIEYDMENQPQPALATSWETTNNADGTQTWTFKLREDVVWVDNQGREVSKLTADDFVAGLQHMMDAAGGLEYLVCAGCANIVNADAYVNGEITDFAEVGIEAIDDYTVAYTLSIPTDYFLTMLGYGVFAPMSREYYVSMGGKFGADFDASAADYKYGKGPDSIAYNGPFRITNHTANNQIVFESNESYWNVAGNNLKKMTFIYTDGSDPQKPYTDFFGGVVDTMGMTAERVEMARAEGIFDKYAYVSETDATTYCGFLNLYRTAFANYNDASVGITPKSEEDVVRGKAALLNQNFRMALLTSIDRATYNEQSVGADLKLNALVNSYTPGTFVNLPSETTVEINGEAKTYAAGTQYGQIVQDQLTADGSSLVVWNGTASTGFDGWYNVDAAKAYLAAAVEELAAVGVEVSAENPIYIDMPVRTDSEVNMNMKQAVKQSVEAATDGMIIINLVEYNTRDTYLDATYWYGLGNEANFDINDGSGWGPDYGDPSTYLGTMLPQYAGYMVKSLGIF